MLSSAPQNAQVIKSPTIKKTGERSSCDIVYPRSRGDLQHLPAES